MKEFTRNQRAILNFEQSTGSLRNAVFDLCGLTTAAAYDEIINGISCFMLSELNYRQSDRCVALDVRPDLQADAKKQADQFQVKGLTGFNAAKNLIESQLPNIKPLDINSNRAFAEIVNRLLVEARNEISELELKASDAKELDEVVKSAFSILSKATNEKVFAENILSNLVKMIEIRSSIGRGALTNIAVWKLVAAAVLLGIAVWVVYKCFYSKWSCSKSEKAIYNSIISVALIVFGACD
jgi:hypothetical protein